MTANAEAVPTSGKKPGRPRTKGIVMEQHQYRTDGAIDVTELNAFRLEQAKCRAIIAVANPTQSGVYRVKFVDAQYDRTCWDTYELVEAELAVGTLVYAGAS